MKRAILFVAAFVLTAAALHAQTIVGTWQGTLPIAATAQGSTGGPGVRVIFTVEKNADGSFHGGLIWIDRGISFPLASVVFSAPNVTFAQTSAAPTYRGKLSADGKSIAGTWLQGDQTYPLTLELATADTLWKRNGPEPLPPMAANADPSFDVATIKPALPEEAHALFDLHARRFNATGMTATELIKVAYNVRGRQVLGGPPWLNDTRYDVVAEPDTPGLPSETRPAPWCTSCSPTASTSSPTPTSSSSLFLRSRSIPKARIPRPAIPTSAAAAACPAGGRATTSSCN